MFEAFVAWILAAMISLAPPHRQHWEPTAQESYAQADARYLQIAETIAQGVFDPEILPVMSGPRGRQDTAMLVVIWWNSESGFRRDVDLGLGRKRLARAGWNDYGKSWCMGQINLGRKPRPDPDNLGQLIEESATTTAEGWTGRDLCNDRRKCLIATMNVMRRSIGVCRALPVDERMAAYVAGYCESEAGKRISRFRMQQFWQWRGKDRPNYTDAQVMASLGFIEDTQKSASK